ncbi:MAG: hypothetical protein WAM60_13520 [Candidatus Promineifilaceae bacterium]
MFYRRRRRFFSFILTTILLLGLCGLISTAAYHSGWSQGYFSAQTADGPTAGNVTGAPFVPGGGFPGIFSFLWTGLAAFFIVGFIFFFVGSIFRLLFWGRRGRRFGRPFGPWRRRHWRRWARRHGYGPDHEGHFGEGPFGEGPHGKGWHGFKGQNPPWYDDSNGEPVMKA